MGTQWEDEGSCSATCGEGTIKRVRYLQATKTKPEHVIEGDEGDKEGFIAENQIYRREFSSSEFDSRTREMILSFASGGLVSFVGVMIVMLALRSRRQTVTYSGVDGGQ